VTASLLAVLGILAGVFGVVMGWVLAAFMAWSAAGVLRRLLRRDPVLTVDATGVHDHRIPVTIAWQDVERMRTVDRRVLLQRIPLLELVPVRPLTRDTGSVLRAVLRGDLSVVDARDASRLVVDLQHLDATPEQVLAAARAARR
jgi:hypothetical protein